MTVSLVQIGLFQLRRSRQYEIGKVGGVGQEEFVNDGKEIVAAQAFDNTAGVGTGRGRVGAKDVERLNRRVGGFTEQGRAKTVHVDGAARSGTAVPVLDGA